MISAEIILDSQFRNGPRLTTFVLAYPRFIHAQFMTHRVFSRNASSSRAIPIQKMIRDIEAEPAKPIFWGVNQRGMQAEREISPAELIKAERTWLDACKSALIYAEELSAIGVHKQVSNRILEPFMHITVICTATSYGNWFNLRYHDEAQPEIAELAKVMWKAYSTNLPNKLEQEWELELGYASLSHLPFISKKEKETLELEVLKKCSVARCARVSYRHHDGSYPDIKKDIALHDRLRDSGHWSPFEHVATYEMDEYAECAGNFKGWNQYRKEFLHENREKFTLK